MTTQVTVNANCPSNIEVRVTVTGESGTIPAECVVLQDGESATKYVYDGRVVSVTETAKVQT